MHWEGGWLPSMHLNWEKRVVSILLECFLVFIKFSLRLPNSCKQVIKDVVFLILCSCPPATEILNSLMEKTGFVYLIISLKNCK